MPEPRIKRYTLVPTSGDDGVRRFHLARVASANGLTAERLERMEEIAAGADRRSSSSSLAGRVETLDADHRAEGALERPVGERAAQDVAAERVAERGHDHPLVEREIGI
jgi:hypothetical protein